MVLETPGGLNAIVPADTLISLALDPSTAATSYQEYPPALLPFCGAMHACVSAPRLQNVER